MALGRRTIGQELLDVPFSEMIKGMGLAVAEAQFELDRVGIRLAQMMSGSYEVEEVDPDTGETEYVTHEAYVTFNGERLSLLELGFTPTFYQFVDTLVEVKVSLSMARTRDFSGSVSTKSKSIGAAALPFAAGAGVRSTAVNASYAAKYQYSAEGSSLMRTKLVPVPPPAVLEERIRKVVEARQAEEAAASTTP